MILKGAYGVCTVIHDPDTVGGFAAGAELNGVVPMLAQGAFTPGTVIRLHGRRLLVLGAAGSKQRLIMRR